MLRRRRSFADPALDLDDQCTSTRAARGLRSVFFEVAARPDRAGAARRLRAVRARLGSQAIVGGVPTKGRFVASLRRSPRRETREADGARAAPTRCAARPRVQSSTRCSRRRRGLLDATTTTTSSTSSRAPATGHQQASRAAASRCRRRPHRGPRCVSSGSRGGFRPDPVRLRRRAGDRTGTFLRTDTAGRTARAAAGAPAASRSASGAADERLRRRRRDRRGRESLRRRAEAAR